MNRGDVARTLLVGGLMALGGYLAGRNLADDAVRTERDEARAEVGRLRETVRAHEAAAPADPRKGLAAPPAQETSMGGAATPSASTTVAKGAEAGATPGERPETLDVKDVTTVDELTQRILAFAASRLAEGPKGHLELLRAMDASLVRDERIGRLLNDDREAVGLVYPMLKFAVNHEGQVTGFLETVFRTMAETPSELEGVDDNTLEMITEGLALVLPSVVSAERLETFRGYVARVLQAPKESLPQGLRSNLSELKQLLQAWAPPMSREELLARLADLPSDPNARREILRSARRLTREDWAQVDVPAVLGPAIAEGDWQALALLRVAAPTGATLASLDARVLQGAARLDGHVAANYLAATGRSSWTAAKGFFDAWLSAGGGQNRAFGVAITLLGPRPSADELRDLAARADLSEENRQTLLAAAGR